MRPVRLGAVGYLNARPLVFGLDQSPRFDLRFDVPSRCASLLHEGATDVGLIPSIEYLRGGPYRIVPDLAIASRGPVASVALYTTKPMRDVRSIAMDTSSRTSVALVRVLCARLYKIQPTFETRGPDLADMLALCDAALIIGDNALFLSPAKVRLKPDTTEDRIAPRAGSVRLQPDQDAGSVRLQSDQDAGSVRLQSDQDAGSVRLPRAIARGRQPDVEKIDLGDTWTDMTGLPFVYAFWAGRPDALTAADVAALHHARNEGIARPDELARAYFPDQPERQDVAARYLRDNIKYFLGDEERAGLALFYRYAAEAGVVEAPAPVQFYGQV